MYLKIVWFVVMSQFVYIMSLLSPSVNLPDYFDTVPAMDNITVSNACSYKCGIYITEENHVQIQNITRKNRQTSEQKRPYLCGPVDMKYCTNMFLDSLKTNFENIMLKERQAHKKRSTKIVKRELETAKLKLNQMVSAKLSEEWMRQEKILNETISKVIESHVPYHFKIMVMWSIASFVISSFLIFLVVPVLV